MDFIFLYFSIFTVFMVVWMDNICYMKVYFLDELVDLDFNDGVIGVFKPCGITSAKLGDCVKMILGVRKCGHGGTLDPMASGVMVFGIGKGTKEIWNIGQDKGYVGEFLLGQKSETLDVESEMEVVCGDVGDVDLNEVKEVCSSFIGKIEQMPPKFSAKRVAGKRAYDLARSGEDVVLSLCEVEIHSINVLEYDFPRLKLEVSCGKGTYIRSLGDDIASALGFEAAVMSSLVRTKSGEYELYS
jgi:tRNA pseudouridine55 synthase